MPKESWKDYYSRENIDFLGDLYLEFRKNQAPIEAGFAIKVLNLQKGEKVLDLCCGMGHNAVYLAKHGIQVMGVDYSDYSIQKARILSAEEAVDVSFWEGDAREIPWVEEFDGAVMLFNSFGYCMEEEENLKILTKLAVAIKSQGRFLVEVLSRDFAVAQARKGSDEYKIGDRYHWQEYQFDSKRGIFQITRIIFKKRNKRRFDFYQRAYTYSELNYLMSGVGLEITSVCGGYDGGPFTLDSQSLIIIGHKR